MIKSVNDINKGVELNKIFLNNEKIFVPKDDKVIMNCIGQSCNFSRFQE